MQRLSNQELERLQNSYVVWVTALSVAVCGKRSQAGLQQKIIEGSKIGTSIRELTPEIVGTWLDPKRATIPSRGAVQDRLSSLITEFAVPRPSELPEGMAFDQLVDALRSQRSLASKKGRADETIDSDLLSRDVVRVGAVLAKDLNQIDLLLGSGDFDGGLPPYIGRDIDVEIQSVLNSETARLLVISGSPKTGKTRALVENLKRSNLADSKVYWLKPGNNSLQSLIEAMPVSPQKRAIAVLDDLQIFRFEGDGALTLGVLNQLLDRFMVVATIHTQTIDSWNLSKTDHRIESREKAVSVPADAVQKQIESAAISLNSQLSEDEFLRLNESFPNRMGERPEYLRLAAALSASDVLIAKAKMLSNSEDPMSAAAFAAIVDCRILWPEGFSIEQLMNLAQAELAEASNLPWSSSRWDALLDNLTTGVNASAPHAILMRSIGDKTLYTLFDPIWDALKPKEWSSKVAIAEKSRGPLDVSIAAYLADYEAEAVKIASSLDPDPDGLVSFWLGAFWAQIGDHEEALSHFRKSSDLGDVDASYEASKILQNLDKGAEAEVYLRIASEGDNPDATNDLANILEEKNLQEEAETLYLKAISLGSEYASYNLALLKEKQGKTTDAVRLYLEAIEHENTSAMYNLSLIMHQQGNFLEEERLHRLAIEAGLAESLHGLALLREEQGNTDEAEQLYKRAIEAGLTDSITNLALMMEEKEDKREAERLYELAVQAGDSGAMMNLALLHREQGNDEEAERLYKQAVDAGHAGAMNNLAILREQEGDTQEAERLYKQAIDAGNTKSIYNLADMYETLGDLKSAAKYYKQAIGAGHAGAMVKAALRAEEQGNTKEAERLYKQAVDAGHAGAMNNLAILREHQGSAEEAETLFRQAIDAGDSNSIYNLADMYETRGNVDSAKELFRRAVELGVEDAAERLKALDSQ